MLAFVFGYTFNVVLPSDQMTVAFPSTFTTMAQPENSSVAESGSN
jgi:hypothetical protein